MERPNALYRQVSRLPAGLLTRLDALAVAASAATGKDVSRAAIIRAVLSAGLAAAEGDADFARAACCALIKRGRKAGAAAAGRLASAAEHQDRDHARHDTNVNGGIQDGACGPETQR
jgi:hypothetical protein